MLHGMAVCKMRSVDLTMVVAQTSVGQSRTPSLSWSNFIDPSFCSPTSASTSRRAHPVQSTYHAGSSHHLPRRLAAKWNDSCYKISSSIVGKQKFSLVRRVPFFSLSRVAFVPLMKDSRKLHSKAEARLSDASDLSQANKQIGLSSRHTKVDSEARGRSSGDGPLPSIASPPAQSEGNVPVNLAVGVGVTVAVISMAALGFMVKPRTRTKGSVSDLVKRGQLRSDRGGTRADTLLYEDPFDNPLVKTVKKNPLVKMCGKMFRLAPVTLTKEKVAEHQNRRIQAYKWKRPIVFLNEGDPVPEGVDSEEVRWIPSNHPFATTSSFIDEDLAQRNVYQTRGVPSRVRAEHEALRKQILDKAQREDDFQLPNLKQPGAKTWKFADETPGGTGDMSSNEIQSSDSPVGLGKQEEKAEGKWSGLQNSVRSSVPDSKYRTIDFSGEGQGSNWK